METGKSSQESNKSDTKTTNQVRIDEYWHKTLKVDAARAGTTVRELLEACLGESYQKVKEDYGLDK